LRIIECGYGPHSNIQEDEEMNARRQGRMAEEIQRLLSELIPKEIKDPRLGFLTITRVIVSSDLQHAAVYVSVLGSEEDTKQTMQILEKVKGYLRREVGHALGVRITPELAFKLDQSVEEGTRVLKIMQDLEAGQ
jgi:ribosome-binding factor A